MRLQPGGGRVRPLGDVRRRARRRGEVPSAAGRIRSRYNQMFIYFVCILHWLIIYQGGEISFGEFGLLVWFKLTCIHIFHCNMLQLVE